MEIGFELDVIERNSSLKIDGLFNSLYKSVHNISLFSTVFKSCVITNSGNYRIFCKFELSLPHRFKLILILTADK